MISQLLTGLWSGQHQKQPLRAIARQNEAQARAEMDARAYGFIQKYGDKYAGLMADGPHRGKAVLWGTSSVPKVNRTPSPAG